MTYIVFISSLKQSIYSAFWHLPCSGTDILSCNF